MKARYTQISPTGFQCTKKLGIYCEDENEQQYSKLSLFGHIEITVRSYYYKVYEFFLTPYIKKMMRGSANLIKIKN